MAIIKNPTIIGGKGEDLDTPITNLENAANDLDLEIDKLPDRYAGQYNVKQIINGDECRLEINEAPTESYYVNKMRSIVDGTVTELTEQDLMGATKIKNYSFYGCNKLASITIPSSVTSIGDTAFESCSGLTTIIMPNSVTSIGYQAFGHCSSLTSITIPDSVTSINAYAFWVCSSLSSVTYKGQAPNIQNGTFSSCSNVQLYDFRNCITVPSLYSTSSLGHKSGCQIVVPDALYDEWQQATNWSSLTDVVWVKSSEYVEVI